ncbi:hypothetical protein D3C80_2165250 [compost metagenome]
MVVVLGKTASVGRMDGERYGSISDRNNPILVGSNAVQQYHVAESEMFRNTMTY